MQPSEAALILAKIASFDRRTVGEADARAWAEVLDGKATLEDALAAVTEHFTRSRDWLMPVNIIELAKEIRQKRLREAGLPDLPNGLDAGKERTWLSIWRHSIAEGMEPATAQYRADRSIAFQRSTAEPVPVSRIRELIQASPWPRTAR